MSKLTPKQARTEWVKDLRSGDFKQCVGSLNRDNEFCCLGVACETMRRCEGDDALPRVDTDREFSYGEYDEGSVSPLEVMVWLGLRTADGQFLTDDVNGNLINANDEAGWKFKQIADLISEEPDGLFNV